ncbi:MAG: carboxypeptidase regulatory-like domain-containing protein, partial [Campylobacterota bacterium]|nr:carboxypeptidase regulatory-like domain-containing protein [Campylobacterota bacterium]
MITNKKIFFLTLISLFLFSGCVQKRLVVKHPHGDQSNTLPVNTWAQETNVKEDVDISDLDQKIHTEQHTVITEKKPQVKIPRVHFPLDEYNRLAKSGKGTVKGKIYIHDAYNKRVLGANTRLYLNPVTSYSKQWYSESYIGGYKMKKADSRLYNYLKFTASNNKGEFAFYGVPNGRYYLIGTVACGVECGYSQSKNIRIAKQVSIQGNQVIHSDL